MKLHRKFENTLLHHNEKKSEKKKRGKPTDKPQKKNTVPRLHKKVCITLRFHVTFLKNKTKKIARGGNLMQHS